MMRGFGGFGSHGRGRGGPEAPVELRFVDLLLIVVATVMFMAVLLTVVSALSSNGRPDVAPRITTVSAPAALTGRPYQLTLAAVGEGTLTWQLVRGPLPSGLALDPSGVLHGTAARAEQDMVTIGVRDDQHRTDQRQLLVSTQLTGPAAPQPSALRVESPTVLLPDGIAGRPFHYAFGANADTPPLTWRLAGGTLPAGTALAGDGSLVGNPDDAGTSDFTMSVTDATGAATRQHVRLVVQPAPAGWWGQVWTWVLRIITWIGYVLVAVVLWTIVFGTGPDPGHPGLIDMFRG